MLSRFLSSLMILAGLTLTAAGTPDVAHAFLSDTTCLESTQYDTGSNSIRECDAGIECDDPSNNTCKRRSATYMEDGYTVTAVFCSCHELRLSGPPTGTCHVWRKHKGSSTTPECAKGGCPDGQSCKLQAIPGVVPTVYTCSCVGAAGGSDG